MNQEPDLDIQVATEVFGLVRCTSNHDADWHCYAHPDTPDQGTTLCSYSKYLAAAFEVEEWLFEQGWRVICWRLDSGRWWVSAKKPGKSRTALDGDTLPEAICRVAIAVKRAMQ